MLETYKLALRVMDMFIDLNPWTSEEDMFEDNLKWTAEQLLMDNRAEIISQLEEYELEPNHRLYQKLSDLIADIRAYEIPDLWWRDTGKDEVA